MKPKIFKDANTNPYYERSNDLVPDNVYGRQSNIDCQKQRSNPFFFCFQGNHTGSRKIWSLRGLFLFVDMELGRAKFHHSLIGSGTCKNNFTTK